MKYPYEDVAKMGLEMPEGLAQPEQLHFLSLRWLYRQWQKNAIDKETAIHEKGKLTYSLNVAMNAKKWSDLMFRVHSDLMKNVEGAANAYAKDRTLENADKLYEAIYGVTVRHKQSLSTPPWSASPSWAGSKSPCP